MGAKEIYTLLRSEGMSHAGACGIMGNMQAESELKSTIVQRGMQKKSDEDYTLAFDVNPESYIYDSVGYGLCQWTFWSRKKNLRQFAQNWGVSVGAEDMQVCFAVYELKTDFPALWQYLCQTSDVSTASDRVCKEFERPAVNNLEVRRNFAVKFAAQFAGTQTQSMQKAQQTNSAVNSTLDLKAIADALEVIVKIIRGST